MAITVQKQRGASGSGSPHDSYAHAFMLTKYNITSKLLILLYTQGGESTRDEMCFTFLLYYPQVDLNICVSQSSRSSYETFAQQHIE